MATKGTAKTTGVYNVSEMLKKEGLKDYSSVQGYTLSTDSSAAHFFAASNTVDDKKKVVKTVFGRILGGKISVSKSFDAGHANDCAYYNNGYFIAQGGGNITNNKILRIDKDMSKVTEYKYEGSLSTITGIACIGAGYFLVAGGVSYACCSLDEKKLKFTEETKFTISEDVEKQFRPSGYDQLRQGIYVAGGRLYRIYSYSKNNVITKNNIAVFKLKGKVPLYNGAALESVYSCDKSGKKKFEVESISSPNASSMYVLANVVDGNDTGADRIYSVSFS